MTSQKLDGFSISWISVPSCFLKGTEVVGLIAVYVDDFLVAGCDDDPIFSAALSKLEGTFHW